MKTIFLVCRQEKETPLALIQLMEALFPECEVRVIYEPGRGSSSPSPMPMEGL